MALSWCGLSCCMHSQSQGTTTVRQQPVEDSRAITQLQVTSVSPQATKDLSLQVKKGLVLFLIPGTYPDILVV